MNGAYINLIKIKIQIKNKQVQVLTLFLSMNKVNKVIKSVLSL